MKECLFCKIVSGKILSHKVYEDENVVGILDLFPNTEGQSLVISKKHYPSDYAKMPEDAFREFLTSAKKLTHELKRKLEVNRVALAVEGVGVDHAHIKLFPLHGLGKNFKPSESKEKVYHKTYPGFIETRLGKRADDEELARIANRIRGR